MSQLYEDHSSDNPLRKPGEKPSHPASREVATSRNSTISARLSPTQKRALQVLAKQSNRTLSGLVLDSLQEAGAKQLDAMRSAIKKETSRRRRSRKPREFRPLKTPFLREADAAGFEEVVHYVAEKMNCDAITIAVLLTHLGEAIGNVLAKGEVFRWPGVLIAGSYATVKSGVACSVPRFQANPPLIEHVKWSCPVADACNKQMDAHRRRRRPDRSGSLSTVMGIARNCYLKQDKERLRFLEDNWRRDSDHIVDDLL